MHAQQNNEITNICRVRYALSKDILQSHRLLDIQIKSTDAGLMVLMR